MIRTGEFFSYSSLLLASRGVQIPLPHPLKMPTPARRILLPSPFSLSFLLLTLISHRLKRPLSPRLFLFLRSGFALLPFRYLFFVSPLFLPTARRSSHLASLLIFQSVSQSERQSPQSCKVTPSQTIVPAETYSKRLCFLGGVFWFFSCPRG